MKKEQNNLKVLSEQTITEVNNLCWEDGIATPGKEAKFVLIGTTNQILVWDLQKDTVMFLKQLLDSTCAKHDPHNLN
jgi:hypothetical protein